MRRYYTLLQQGKGRMEALLAVQREFPKLGRVAALRRHRAPAGVVREQPQGQRHRSAWRIFNDVNIHEERMATAKLFRSGKSQAVSLPQEFRLDVDEVEIFRQDGDLVLRPRPREGRRGAAIRYQSPSGNCADSNGFFQRFPNPACGQSLSPRHFFLSDAVLRIRTKGMRLYV